MLRETADPGPEWSGTLVGREAECEVIEQALARLADGGSQVIELTGDPGIGKSRLLAEMARRAGERGLLVLAGRARHGGERVPFYALADALDDHLAGRVLDGLAAHRDVLGLVFPSLRRPGMEHAGVTCERYRLFRAVRALLESLAAPQLVLLLDDLQWADEDTAEVLAQLLRQPPRGRVLLALAYRWRQAPARLRAAVAAARGDHPPAHLRLGPLSEAEAETMLGGRGSRPWRRGVYRASGGNPFYLDALARRAGEPGRPGGQQEGAAGGELPAAVAAALIDELLALSPAGQLAARSAAVIGDPFCVTSVGQVSGLGPERAAAAIDELAAADLIRPIEPAGLFSFRHTIVRSAVYESAQPAWRVGAHGQAAAALRHCGAPLTAQAYHIERAAEFGDLTAVGLLADAAGTVQAQAPGTAAQWLEAALRLLPEDAGTQQRTALLLRLALALGAAGHPRESRDTLHTVLGQLGSDQQDTRVEAVTFCALMERQLSRHQEGKALLLAELSALADADTAAAAALRFELGSAELAAGNPAGARRWALEALPVAERCGPAGLRAAVLGLLTKSEAISSDVGSAIMHVTAAASVLDGMLDGELEQRPEAALLVGWSEFLLDRPGFALRHLDRGLALAHRGGRALTVAPLLIGRILALRATGQLAEASAAAEEAVELAALSGYGEHRTAALALRAWVATWTGDLEAARATAAIAAEQWPRHPRGWRAFLAARTLSDARLAMGDPEGCLALATSAAVTEPPDAADWARIGWYELLTRAELAAGHPPAAIRWADAAVATARRRDLPGSTGLALLARAQAVAATDAAAASGFAAAARDALSGAGMVLDAARAALVNAAALAARGSRDQASTQAQTAQSVFESCGAAPYARKAASLRRRIVARGSRGQPETGNGAGRTVLSALTRRERQVASLVSQGLTNRRIAQRLHVTDKTIEMHLSNIFAKLGVSSRTETAAAVIRGRLPAQ
ncbi:MAG TPA: AAA family ATPase [Streptosporangiaceae bacterium]|nr:AAA family ATPase [Streptosporangiaceae bacterium]